MSSPNQQVSFHLAQRAASLQQHVKLKGWKKKWPRQEVKFEVRKTDLTKAFSQIKPETCAFLFLHEWELMIILYLNNMLHHILSIEVLHLQLWSRFEFENIMCSRETEPCSWHFGNIVHLTLMPMKHTESWRETEREREEVGWHIIN